MEYDIEVEHIVEKIRTLSGSYGTAPYALSIIPFSESIQTGFKIMGVTISPDFLLIGIFIWTDYSRNDMKDFICLSVEYSSLNDEEQESFLSQRLSIFDDPDERQQWMERQASIAIGIMNYVGFNYQMEIVQVPDFMIEDFVSVVPAASNQKLYSLAYLKRDTVTPG